MGKRAIEVERVVVVSTVVVSWFLWAAILPQVHAWTVSCSNPYSACYGMLRTCPSNCNKWCEVDCSTCLPKCTCDKPGAVCQDPRFIGGDGIMFYFHGEKDADFCIVSDSNLHINAHFIGKRGQGMTRDFTWVQSIGILFGTHTLYMGANKVAIWDNHVDALALSYDGSPISLPPREGAVWEIPSDGIKVARAEGKNAVSIEVEASFKLSAHVVAIDKHESRIHKYNITSDNSFAHLELNFEFFNLSTAATGVLGQTYVPNYISPVKVNVPMPIMGGEKKFRSSSLFRPDCVVSKFGAASSGESMLDSRHILCGKPKDGHGFVCRR